MLLKFFRMYDISGNSYVDVVLLLLHTSFIIMTPWALIFKNHQKQKVNFVSFHYGRFTSLEPFNGVFYFVRPLADSNPRYLDLNHL